MSGGISEFRQLEGDLYGTTDSDSSGSEGFVDRVRDQTASNVGFLADPLNILGGVPESTADGLIDTVTPGSGGDAGRPDSAGDLLPTGSVSAGVDDGSGSGGSGGGGSGGGNPLAQLGQMVNLITRALPLLLGLMLLGLFVQLFAPLLDEE
jgi:hypothetical protein